LIWIDLLGDCVKHSDLSSGTTTTLKLAKTPGAVATRAAGGLVAAVAGGFAAIDDDGRLEMLAELEHDRPTNRMNDGKCAPDGSFWAGTMDRDARAGAGSLYRLDPSLQVSRILTGLTVSNGLGWSPDGGVMYFIDTADASVDLLRQGAAGVWTRTPLVHVDPSIGSVDGLTVDAEGNIWVAVCFGGCVLCYSPDGQLVANVSVPAKLTTSVAFGGDDLELLFITTGRTGLGADDLRRFPHSGSVFVAVPGSVGLPPSDFLG
jgi:sugar lactone lactonase YvrE